MPSSIQVEAKHELGDALHFLSGVPKNENGHISWDSLRVERGTFEVIYSLKFKPNIEDHIKDGAVWHVLNECARQNDFSQKFFLQRLRTYISTHLSKDQKKFLATAQINAKFNTALPSKIPSLNGSIHINHTPPKIFRLAISKLTPYEKSRLGLHDDFVYMTYHVTNVSERSAVDIAYRDMKYALGTLNLATHGYGVSKRFGFPNAPIGKFLLASPISILDAKARTFGGWQSENHYPIPWKNSFNVWQRQPTDEISKYSKYFSSDLSRIDFKERLVQAVVLLQEGLESTHIDIALLKFWTGMEVLCAKEEREPSDRVVERVSSIFSDSRHVAMRLNFIQEFRNKIVHRGEAGDHALLCAQYGSIYLSVLIEFMLWNRYKFRKRDLILDFLSMPLDEEKLLRHVALGRKRLKLLGQSRAQKTTPPSFKIVSKLGDPR